MSNSSQTQNSSQQQPNTSEKPEVSETTKQPEKRELIKFEKTVDLMLGAKKNSEQIAEF